MTRTGQTGIIVVNRQVPNATIGVAAGRKKVRLKFSKESGV